MVFSNRVCDYISAEREKTLAEATRLLIYLQSYENRLGRDDISHVSQWASEQEHHSQCKTVVDSCQNSSWKASGAQRHCTTECHVGWQRWSRGEYRKMLLKEYQVLISYLLTVDRLWKYFLVQSHARVRVLIRHARWSSFLRSSRVHATWSISLLFHWRVQRWSHDSTLGWTMESNDWRAEECCGADGALKKG